MCGMYGRMVCIVSMVCLEPMVCIVPGCVQMNIRLLVFLMPFNRKHVSELSQGSLRNDCVKNCFRSKICSNALHERTYPGASMHIASNRQQISISSLCPTCEPKLQSLSRRVRYPNMTQRRIETERTAGRRNVVGQK